MVLQVSFSQEALILISPSLISSQLLSHEFLLLLRPFGIAILDFWIDSLTQGFADFTYYSFSVQLGCDSLVFLGTESIQLL